MMSRMRTCIGVLLAGGERPLGCIKIKVYLECNGSYQALLLLLDATAAAAACTDSY